ncbi:MAG: amidohydrolase family protein [Longimicrobiales bacterium]
MWLSVRVALALLIVASLPVPALAQRQGMEPTPPRGDQGEGPFERLIIRGATVIDGTGAPPQGPVDIVIENNRIASLRSVGYPGVPIDEESRPGEATREIDASGMYVLPGLIDVHVHTGGVPKAPQPDYTYKLWLGHGITTVRGVGFGEFDWQLEEKAKSARNEIVAPHMVAYARPGSGGGWNGGPIDTPERAREWVRWARDQGVDGLKLGSSPPPIMEALIDEAHRQDMGTVAHLGQMGVAHMNALDAARLGLDDVTHFYGLFESMLEGRSLQDFPVDYNYNDEQHRFGQVARLWDQVHPPGSEVWNETIEEFLELGTIFSPTMTIYSAGRDVMRARNADWHDEYTLPTQWDFYQPSREAHGSYWFDWTTTDEVAWRNFYHRWMQWLDDYNDAGGRIATGSDAGFIYQLYGFGLILELELLQEAGLHPLEVVRAATLYGAESLQQPREGPVDYGVLRPGARADLIVVDGNPLQNFKILYGTGHLRLDDQGRPYWHRGLKYTIKDGIIYDSQQLLADVREMVRAAKAATTATTGN